MINRPKQLSKHLLSLVLLAGFLLAACGETELVKNDEGGQNDPTRRELQLSFLNKLTLNTKGSQTRASIATSNEQRIDMLDVYVFGSLTEDGEYTFQEKFSYRADGSTVAGTTAMEVSNGDGSSAKPTVLLRPKKGLYIKMFCIANQPELSILDNTDAANPVYVPYTNFVPLVQTNPGGDNNTITMGVPTEADFCKLLSPVIDPVNQADSIVPALPMVGSYVAPIDLHNFDLASRLSAGMRLTRAVARFDVVNDAATSRFVLESVAMGNGRPVTQLYPLQAQKTVDNKLIIYPTRDLTLMPQVNNNKQLPVFYAYGSPVEDEAYLILKGKYQMNATDTQEVSYNVPFSQVVDGTGSRIAINPNHRYTIAITKADPQHVDFDFTVADWENGEDLGNFTPDNAFGTISVQPADQFNAATRTMAIDAPAGSSFTITIENSSLPIPSLSYDEGGNEWLEATVNTAPATRAAWGQTTTCTVKVKTGIFTSYPNATLRLTNSIDGSYSEIHIIKNGVELSNVTAKAGNTNSVAYNADTQILRFTGLNKEDIASVVVKSLGALIITKPDWLKVNGAPNTGYTLSFIGSPVEYTTTPAIVTFAAAKDVSQRVRLNVQLDFAAIMVGGVKWATGNLDYNSQKGFFFAPTPDQVSGATATRQVRGSYFRWMSPYPQNMQNSPSTASPTSQTWVLATPTWTGTNDLGNYSYYRNYTITTTFTPSRMDATTLGDPCRAVGNEWRLPTYNEIYLLCHYTNSNTPSNGVTINPRNYLKHFSSSQDMNNITSYPTDDSSRWYGVYFAASTYASENPSAPGAYTEFDPSKHLFLPASGYSYGTAVTNAGSSGLCMTSTPGSNNNNSWYINTNSSGVSLLNGNRHNARGIRCVSNL